MRCRPQAIPSTVDLRLVSAAQADRSAFAAIYERHVTNVYRYVMRRTGNPDLSEDLTAETFERAFGAIEHYEWRGAPLVSWLLRIADRACTDWYRNSARKREDSFEAGLANLPGLPSAEDEAVQAESDSRLYSALETLTPARREVVMLHLGEGISLAAISRRLGRGESAVRMLYARGLRDLRARLDDG
jgi:RNA polymerase sigma-70 factor (ECF subfamily)